jgi:hypothetical protein
MRRGLMPTQMLWQPMLKPAVVVAVETQAVGMQVPVRLRRMG